MQRVVNLSCALVLALQAAVLAAACSTSTVPSMPPGNPGGAGGTAGEGGPGGSGGAGAAGGAGASGGAGGIGGAAGMRMPELTLPEHQAWLNDQRNWQPLPGQESWDRECSFWTSVPDRIALPVLTWEPCGEGCARADVLQGHGNEATYAALGISTAGGNGRPFLRMAQGLITSGGHDLTLHRIIDLTSGVTSAVLQEVEEDLDNRARCGGSIRVLSGVEMAVGRLFPDGGPSVAIRGTWNPVEKSWLWQQPWPTQDEMGFGTSYCDLISMESGGRTFWLCGYAIRGAITPGSSEYTELDRMRDAGFYASRGDALGDLAVWSELREGQTGSRVRGWSPDGRGVRTLMDDVPVDTCATGVSDTHVAGFSTAGACDYFNHEGRLWIADRQADGTLSNFRLGPIFSADRVAEAEPVRTWGDFVSVVWGPEIRESRDERRQLLLARASDWTMRNLKAPAGHEVYMASLTDDYLYVVFSLSNGAGWAKFTHVYRYDLAKFESIGEPVEPVAEPAAPSQR